MPESATCARPLPPDLGAVCPNLCETTTGCSGVGGRGECAAGGGLGRHGGRRHGLCNIGV